MEMLNLAVVGAGLIGKSHIRLIKASDSCNLVAIVDPFEESKLLAEEHHVPHFSKLSDLISVLEVDGVILATPNSLHVEQAMACIEAGIPVLIEKPISHSVSEANTLVNLASRSEEIFNSILIGHHRMHSPIMQRTREVIDSGVLGDVVAVNGSALFYKPDEYFLAAKWRTQEGGGPILINLIHDIGNLRYMCGEITAVQAIASNRHRNFDVEDSVGITLAFENGAIGTFILSDTAGSGQSWEQTSQENKAYTTCKDEDCYHVAGTSGSLSVPTMRLKYYTEDRERSWWKPFESERVSLERDDPLRLQLQHFCNVIRKTEPPLVTVHDGLQNLRVTEAVVKAVKEGKTIYVDDIH
ncbi:oxidoreductase [Veronia nyctiphanis]|uniref:Oxidoreductase n=1 Tax=Veronia nyctiphanis TaxID=1278244 RepID=A0A4Q0YPF4_9GAMM|nr:Gfo/Idh/MocA family oxidoreductase [Veronia nyctiphanis]RXJ72826.1 oxidoreductase [Veronia nyctiphanis]